MKANPGPASLRNKYLIVDESLINKFLETITIEIVSNFVTRWLWFTQKKTSVIPEQN